MLYIFPVNCFDHFKGATSTVYIYIFRISRHLRWKMLGVLSGMRGGWMIFEKMLIRCRFFFMQKSQHKLVNFDDSKGHFIRRLREIVEVSI